MITFRRLAGADLPLVGRRLSHPHVARWWNQDSSPEAVARDFGPATRGEDTSENLIALLDGEPLGLVQFGRLADEPADRAAFASLVAVPPHAVTLDYLVGEPDRVGRGLGTRMISAALRRVWREYPRAEAVLVAVVAANTASWRALEKAGMTRVGSGAMEPDNPVDDPLHHVYRADRPS
ncbi:aminoglycoside 6'-N-acetyltransferase [Haloactinospora alba]|uniref:Aminoglycoside 6'-N-acetyltransferase n=1 Tax=Haloactinospora alba TaxID=405555 RepID=A0A543NNG8_9ACTN|nr:GNAT family N-acetyltransferase [Haloactinospora alba]TQN33372.1 aminoglycoside 6'-N-acetyltransferase [Haloactinospora alba]